jgi:membrane protease YdiL (CAAX protease family)
MQEIKDHFGVLLFMTLINLIVLWKFITQGNLLHGIGYFLFFYLAIFIIHLLTKNISFQKEIIAKEPKKELKVAILFSGLAILSISLNFLLKKEIIPSNILTKIPILLGNLFFAIPLGLVIYLLIKKYKIFNLGLNVKPILIILLGIMIWALTGLFAYFFNPEGILWSRAIEEFGGIFNIIIEGVIGAALAEEFSRFVIQSRFERIFKANGMNILFATTIWSLMHFPVSYYKSEFIFGSMLYCLQIIPLGFIWGYLTQRTKSILPSTLAHGFNLWGFQNG